MQNEHMSPVAVSVEHCTKRFGKVVANHDVHMELKWGEIHALLGENGSGKTTLVNMLAGIYQPDEGSITVDGKPVTIVSPRDAYSHGIGMIHQHFMLVDVLTAAENIVLGLSGSAILNYDKVASDIKKIADTYGFSIKPEQRIADMSVSEKQTVEIVKTLYRGAEILILDEPTAVLTPQETDRLFEILKTMKAQGKAILLISHKMSELFAVADRVTILRKGEYIDTIGMKEATLEKLTSDMVGHAIDLTMNCVSADQNADKLVLKNVTVENADGAKMLNGVSFSANGGEIFGIAGVAGSGQRELCDVIAGLNTAKEGSIFINNKDITHSAPEDIQAAGIHIAYVPEDRLGMGLVPTLGMVDNIMLRCYKKSKSFFLDRKSPTQLCKGIVDSLEVSLPDLKTPVRRLSGGNVQKVLLGREISSEPDVLIAAYPVRGLDIGASQKVYDMLNEQKKRGACVVYVGEDIDVLMGLCDRIMVMCNGSVAGIVRPADVTKNDIGLMMMGQKVAEKEVRA